MICCLVFNKEFDIQSFMTIGRSPCIDIFRLRLEIFHTFACFRTLVWKKSYASMGLKIPSRIFKLTCCRIGKETCRLDCFQNVELIRGIKNKEIQKYKNMLFYFICFKHTITLGSNGPRQPPHIVSKHLKLIYIGHPKKNGLGSNGPPCGLLGLKMFQWIEILSSYFYQKNLTNCI